jgi:hypothetical protein
MIIVTVLMYTISLSLQLPSYVTIHNQCPNIELVLPVYFGNGAVCPKLSNQQTDVSTKMNASFEINPVQDELEGALLYKLKRCPDIQHTMDISTKEANEVEAKCTQMFIAWKVKGSKPFVYVVLVEHAKEFTWDEDKLRKLYNMNHNRLKEYNSIMPDKWLMDDNMVLKTSFEVRGLKGNFELSISISEEKYCYCMKPLCVDLER